MRADSRHILLISYHFPPSAAVGGQRIANFARYLSRCGWHPGVLTIRDEDVERLDPGRLGAVEGIDVYKARRLPTAITLASGFNKLARRWFGRTSPAAGDPSMASSRPAGARPAKETLTRRMKRYVMSFLTLPDHERGWILPASVAAIRIIRREGADWFLTSCPPYSGHVIGIVVKKITGKRWVADFRDPWMTTGSKRMFPTSALSIKVESWLERQVMEHCDLALFNVERLKNAYRDRYSDLPAEKFAFLPNGIPPQEPQGAPVTKYEHFTLSYTGSLYVGRSPEPVFEAVSQLIGRGTVPANAIRIKLVGQCQQINGIPTASIIRKHGLESVVDVLEPVSYSESQDIVRRSHLALLFAPNLPYQIPAKVYDYLASGSRILAIAEEGGTADIIRDTGAGQAFEAADVDGIAGFILREFSSRSREADRPAAVGRFDIRKIAAALAQHMERIDTSEAAELRQWAG